MAKIESKIGVIKEPDTKIYEFLSDFNNFEKLIPQDYITDWESTSDSCSFKLSNYGHANFSVIEKEPYKLIKVEGKSSDNSSITLWIQIKSVAENDSRIKLTIKPQLNPMLQMLASGPLKKMINLMVDKLENFHFE